MTAAASMDSASTKPPGGKRLIAAGVVGNVLEWYDFAVYGFLALAIGRHFFPQGDPTAHILAAFGVFAIGYFMRPIGGVIIGHIGDHYGRSAALTASIVLMAIPTFLIGVMPGFQTVGVAAPVILTVLRMLQGLSVGGEYTSSMVFLVESARPERRAFYGAFASMGAIAGILLGSAVAAALSASISQAQLYDWGWRIPFLFGPLIGFAGYFLRRQLVSTIPAGRRLAHPPVVEAFRNHWRLILRIVGLSVVTAISFYVLFVYVASWLQMADGLAPAAALEINTINMVIMLPLILLGGMLSDRIGRKPVIAVSLGLLAVCAWPLFALMHHASPGLAFLGQLGFAVILGPFYGTTTAIMIEAVPREIRCTTVALGYNICLGIAGGTAPMVAAWLVERSAYQVAPAFYIIAAAVISLIALSRFKETYRAPLA